MQVQDSHLHSLLVSRFSGAASGPCQCVVVDHQVVIPTPLYCGPKNERFFGPFGGFGFVVPLSGSHISGTNGRIHCSLNINTETGRLSARRPNLQNQPALEKDRYKIRQAFIATPGNSLIIADYGQDKYVSERRKVKMLNFFIAYGKTPVGLARDWKVSVHEARETVA